MFKYCNQTQDYRNSSPGEASELICRLLAHFKYYVIQVFTEMDLKDYHNEFSLKSYMNLTARSRSRIHIILKTTIYV